MAENFEISPILPINNKRRHLSQTPMPSNNLFLKKSSEGLITIPSIRNRRTVSEQINYHDR